jgi:hypothetical protein
MMKALRLQRLDEQLDIHLSAWLNHQVRAEKKRGKGTTPYYKSFKEFFDYEKELSKLDERKSEGNKKQDEFQYLLAKANRGGGT